MGPTIFVRLPILREMGRGGSVRARRVAVARLAKAQGRWVHGDLLLAEQQQSLGTGSVVRQ